MTDLETYNYIHFCDYIKFLKTRLRLIAIKNDELNSTLISGINLYSLFCASVINGILLQKHIIFKDKYNNKIDDIIYESIIKSLKCGSFCEDPHKIKQEYIIKYIKQRIRQLYFFEDFV